MLCYESNLKGFINFYVHWTLFTSHILYPVITLTHTQQLFYCRRIDILSSAVYIGTVYIMNLHVKCRHLSKYIVPLCTMWDQYCGHRRACTISLCDKIRRKFIKSLKKKGGISLNTLKFEMLWTWGSKPQHHYINKGYSFMHVKCF